MNKHSHSYQKKYDAYTKCDLQLLHNNLISPELLY